VGEPVEFCDEQGVAFPAGGEGFAESGSFTVRTGQAVVDVDPLLLDSECSKASPFGCQVLIDGGDSRVADQELSHGTGSP
jgi:hypothetical protein